jgi:hypothetical protein
MYLSDRLRDEYKTDYNVKGKKIPNKGIKNWHFIYSIYTVNHVKSITKKNNYS